MDIYVEKESSYIDGCDCECNCTMTVTDKDLSEWLLLKVEHDDEFREKLKASLDGNTEVLKALRNR